MGTLSPAVSVHHFISSVGADAGFAAFIGLALLVLLYFAHARETATLREEADELRHRLATLEARLAQLNSAPERVSAAAAAPARLRVAAETPAVEGQTARAGTAQATPAGSAQAVQASSARPATATATAAGADPASSRLAALEHPPGAPAGVAAPALSAATRVIPAGVLAHAGARQPAPVGVATADPPRPGSDRQPVPALAAATAAGASNGGGGSRVAPPPAGMRRAAPAGSRQRTMPPRGAPRRAVPPPDPRGQQPSRGRRGVIVVVAGIVLAVVAAGIILAVSHGSSSSTSSASGSAAPNRPVTRTVAVNPAKVTVAVLNGTPTVGLAHRTAQKLSSVGFRDGRISTAADQTRQATVIAYGPGRRAEALAVAKTLGLGTASVQPLDSSTQAVAFACTPSPCPSDVVVTVGSDLASR